MIYFIIGFCLFVIATHNILTETKERNITYIFFSIVTVMLFAFRSKYVGGDTLLYVQEFQYADFDRREVGWVLFCYIARVFGNTPFIFIFFSSLISIIPFILLVNKYSNNRSLSLLYIFLFANTIIVDLETNLRQNVGTGLFMLAVYIYDGIKDKSWKYKLIPILLLVWGCLCHASLYIEIPLAIAIYFIKLNKKIAIYSILVTYFIGTFTSEYASQIFGAFFIFAGDFEELSKLALYENSENLGNFSDAGLSVGSIFSITLLATTIAACDKEELDNYFIKLLFVYAITYGIFRSSDLMFRLAFTFQFCSFVLVPKAISNKKYRLIFLFLMLVWTRALYQLCTNPVMQNKDANMFPYTTIIEK